MIKTLAKSKLSAADGESFIFEPPKEYLEVIQTDPPSEEDIQKKEKLHAFRLLCEGLARIRHTDKRHWHHRPVFRVSRSTFVCKAFQMKASKKKKKKSGTIAQRSVPPPSSSLGG